MKIDRKHALKYARLLIYLIVFAHSQQTLAAMCQQINKPITKDNLISSIKLGKRERKTAARYIELINRYGVNFLLTPNDERNIRKYGRYLGKEGLDNLIAAVRDNYRPNAARQPSPSLQLEQPTFREQTETVMFSFGESGVTTTFKLSDLQKRPQTPMFMNNVVIAHLSAEGNKLYVDAKIGDINAPVVEIKHNQFTSPPPNWDRNSNQTALEIVDENNIPVFQLYYKTPTHVVMNGIFKYRRDLYLISNSGILMNPTNQGIVARYLSKRIFKYPSWRYPGEYESSLDPNSINQTMTNSPGGIQAGGNVTVNQGIQPRKLTTEQEIQFVNILKDNPKGSIEVSCIESGGPEPCDFARQLVRLLESRDAGWTVNFSPIMFGAGDPTKTIPEMYILVQSNKNPPPRAVVLQHALKSVGYDAIGIERSDVVADFVQLTVWFRRP